MKKIIYLIAFFAMAFSVSCYKEAVYTTSADVCWYCYLSTSSGPGYGSSSLGYGVQGDSTNNIYANSGDYLILRDNSQQALTHKWVIDTTYCYFVSDYDDPDSKIEGNESTDEQIVVYFTTQGYCNMQLVNTFDSYVASYMTNSTEAVYREEYGDWYFEQNFHVGVVAPVSPGYNIVRTSVTGETDTVLVITGFEDLDTVTVVNLVLADGDCLDFSFDRNCDAPYTVASLESWTVPSASKGELEDGSTGTYYFNTATAGAISGFYCTGYRYALGSADASTVKAEIPLTVEVLEEQIQVKTVGVTQTSALCKFNIPFTKEIRTYGDTINWELANAFSVSVYDKVTGLTVSHDVEYVDTTSSLNYLRLVLADSIDNYDKTMTIYYNADLAETKIYSVNDIRQEMPNISFEMEADPYRILSTDYFDFTETTHASITTGMDENVFWASDATYDEPNDDGSYIQFVDEFDGQENLLYFNVASPGSIDVAAILSTAVQTSTYITAGDYNFRAKLYFVSNPSAGDIEFRTNASWSSNTALATLNTEGLSTGSWQTVEIKFTVDEDVSSTYHCVKGFTIKVPADQFPSGISFYIDELYIGLDLD